MQVLAAKPDVWCGVWKSEGPRGGAVNHHCARNVLWIRASTPLDRVRTKPLTNYYRNRILRCAGLVLRACP